MGYCGLLQEENDSVKERYELALERIRGFMDGDTSIGEPYLDYFKKTAEFLLVMDELKQHVDSQDMKDASFEEMKEYNYMLYRDVLNENDNYERSYANPAYAVSQLGKGYGEILSFLYTEIQGTLQTEST